MDTRFPENIDHEYDLKNGRLCLTAELGRKVQGILSFANQHGIPALNRFYISHAYLYSLKDISLANKSMQSFVFASVSSSKK